MRAMKNVNLTSANVPVIAQLVERETEDLKSTVYVIFIVRSFAYAFILERVFSLHSVCPRSRVTSISACHAGDRCSIPSLEFFFFLNKIKAIAFLLSWISKSMASTKVCRNPGLNQGPLYLQSNALPTELFRLIT